MKSSVDLFLSARWSLWARAIVLLGFAGVFLNDGAVLRSTVVGLLAYALIVDGVLGVMRFTIHPRPAWASIRSPNLVWISAVLTGVLVLLDLELRSAVRPALELALIVLFGVAAVMYGLLARRATLLHRYALAAWSGWCAGVVAFVLLSPREPTAQLWWVIPLGLVALAGSLGMITALVRSPAGDK